MTREYFAILIGGIIALVLRLGDVLVKWVAKRLGVSIIDIRESSDAAISKPHSEPDKEPDA